MTIGLVLFILLALFFDFLNGFNDSASLVSTMISSRALSPRTALTLTAIAEFTGPFLFGVAIATTIASDVLVLPHTPGVGNAVIFAALLAAVSWNLITWYCGIPSSSSHALIGGLVGAAIFENTFRVVGRGLSTMNDLYSIFSVVKPAGLVKILSALLFSPVLGFLVAFFLLKTIRFLARGTSPAVNSWFKKGQVITAISLALSHGTNDAQKTMGVITMGLFAAGVIPDFRVPIWVVALSAGAIALGTSTGSWRLIRTLGGKFYKIRPIDGFNSQIASAAVVFGAVAMGGPVSTTQVIASSIIGTGSAERVSKVRWGVGKQILMTWIITIPSTALLAGLLFTVIRIFL